MSKKGNIRKKAPFTRLDEIACADWRPLTLNELRKLAPIKLKSGKISIERELLALLLGERDRLIYVAESARWVATALRRDGIIGRPNYLHPKPLEKAASILAASLEVLDNDRPPETAGVGVVADAIEAVEGDDDFLNLEKDAV